jgi:hypothetical protein
MSVFVKEGVLFTIIAPGGFRLLSAIDTAARVEALTITSACDGEHSGPDDPHHRGEAYDVRSHDLQDKVRTLNAIMDCLEMERFFGFLEDSGTENEHIHIQVKKGTVYP